MGALRLFAAFVALAVAIGAPEPAAAAPRGDDRFAVELYAALRSQPGNLFVSPASLADAFRLALPGAAGPTARQMRQVFHFDAESPAPRFAADSAVGEVELHSANALWLADSLAVRAPFVEAVGRMGDAAVRRGDFKHDPARAAAQINAWAAEATRGRIKGLVSADMVRTDTRAVIANAVYFRAPWSEPFAPQATHPEPFYADGGRQISTPTMQGLAARRYYHGRDFQAVDLPFAGGAFSMVLLLPDARSGLPALEKAATPAAVADWLQRLEGPPREVDLRLPRFQMAEALNAKPPLVELGLRLPFSDDADFSALSPERLSVDEVVHKAFIKVDETGAEATAATAMSLVVTGQRILRPPPVTMRVDHPFMFLVRSNNTGEILFIGRLSDPG